MVNFINIFFNDIPKSDLLRKLGTYILHNTTVVPIPGYRYIVIGTYCRFTNTPPAQADIRSSIDRHLKILGESMLINVSLQHSNIIIL